MPDFAVGSTLQGLSLEAEIDPATQLITKPIVFRYRVNLPSGGYVDRQTMVTLGQAALSLIQQFVQLCLAQAHQEEGI
jgi:hypothetical protein